MIASNESMFFHFFLFFILRGRFLLWISKKVKVVISELELVFTGMKKYQLTIFFKL